MIHGAILAFPFYFNHYLPALQLAPANLQRAIESRVAASTVGPEDKTPLRRSPLLLPAFDANLCTTERLRLSLLAYCVKVCEGLWRSSWRAESTQTWGEFRPSWKVLALAVFVPCGQLPPFNGHHSISSISAVRASLTCDFPLDDLPHFYLVAAQNHSFDVLSSLSITSSFFQLRFINAAESLIRTPGPELICSWFWLCPGCCLTSCNLPVLRHPIRNTYNRTCLSTCIGHIQPTCDYLTVSTVIDTFITITTHHNLSGHPLHYALVCNVPLLCTPRPCPDPLRSSFLLFRLQSRIASHTGGGSVRKAIFLAIIAFVHLKPEYT